MKMIDVTTENVEQTGFFCFMSKRKSEGYRRKLVWCRDRLAEGMRIQMLELPDRGFIEYTPGEHAWRPVEAAGYLFIHCLWVVGKSKKRGFAKALLDSCIEDARSSGFKGVAMITSQNNWLMSRKLLERHGFEAADQAPPSFSLMVKRFADDPLPSFSGNWEAKAAAFGKGLTIIRTDQCPYIDDAAAMAVKTAAKAKIQANVVELTSAAEIRERSPSAYGTFGLVLDGKLLSYHYQLEKDLLPLLSRA